MKNNLDERQNQVVNRIAAVSFTVMFFLGAAAIVIQLILFDIELQNVLGETVMLLGGGIVYLTGCIREGVFGGKGKPVNFMENVLGSIVCAGVFSVFFGIAVGRKAGSDVLAGKLVGYFFMGIAVICFLVLLIMDKCSGHWKRKGEQKYED